VLQRHGELQNHDLELGQMKLIEGQWKSLEQERVRVRQGKKWLLAGDRINCLPMVIFR
jgi:hypothetical protein